MAPTNKDKEREKEKRKRERDVESERFDPNIDSDSVKGVNVSVSPTPPAHHKDGGGPKQHGGPSTSSETSDILKLGDIFKKGFETVTNSLSIKLDTVGNKFTTGLEDLHVKLNNRLTELANENDEGKGSESDQNGDSEREGAGNWDSASDLSELRREHLGTHALSDSSSTKDYGKVDRNYFKKKNVPPPEEKVGDAVDSDLADIANRCFRKPFSADEFQKFKEKYVRPSNCDWIQAPEIPFNIYRRLSGEFKGTDSPLRVVQEHLVPVASSLVMALNRLGKGEFQEGMDTLSETLNGLGYVFKANISEKRRSLLKPKLPEDFRVLVSDKCSPSPTNLLGDISENTKKISETDKITTQMDKSNKNKEKPAKKSNFQPRGKPYDRGSTSSYSSGRKGGFFNRKWDNQRRQNYRPDYKSGNSSGFRRGGQSRK